jgi:hypothetical protein
MPVLRDLGLLEERQMCGQAGRELLAETGMGEPRQS